GIAVVTQTLDTAIDGSTTFAVEVGAGKFTGKATFEKDGNKFGMEINLERSEKNQRFAENEQPKIKEVAPRAKYEPKGTWKEFSNQEQRFAIQFPGTPKTESEKENKDITFRYSVEVENGAIIYMVAVNNFMREFTEKEAKQVLERIAADAEKQKK